LKRGTLAAKLYYRFTGKAIIKFPNGEYRRRFAFRRERIAQSIHFFGCFGVFSIIGVSAASAAYTRPKLSVPVIYELPIN
jgi:hypothetical protein